MYWRLVRLPNTSLLVHPKLLASYDQMKNSAPSASKLDLGSSIAQYVVRVCTVAKRVRKEIGRCTKWRVNHGEKTTASPEAMVKDAYSLIARLGDIFRFFRGTVCVNKVQVLWLQRSHMLLLHTLQRRMKIGRNLVLSSFPMLRWATCPV